jgi:NAD+ kinase
VTAPQARRRVLLVTHTGRASARVAVATAAQRFLAAGLDVALPSSDAVDLDIEGVTIVEDGPDLCEGCELVVVLGGDGTLLRGAEIARARGIPVVGVNLGHVGFLAEAEEADLTKVVDRVVDRDYEVEERLALDVVVRRAGEIVERLWAVNEASLEKASRERMIEVVAEVDNRPLSRWGCDGVVCATPSGSTAYAFSASGPVVWPEVEALLMVPISAHALFARALVVGPSSVLALEVVGTVPGIVWCDGRRSVDVLPRDRVEVTKSDVPLRLARLHHAPFTDRLVAKFSLPVEGWRGRRED